MLAAAARTVKLAADTTPEQQGCSLAIDQALSLFWTSVGRLQEAADQERPIHQVEEVIFRDLLAIGRSLLRAFLASSGTGDVGPTLTLPGGGPDEPPQVLPRLDTPRSRPYLSIFGEVTNAQGREVVDRIGSTQTGRNDRPVQDIKIESVAIERRSS